jgi:VanZ family protein
MRLPRFVGYWMPVIAWLLLIFGGSTDFFSAEHTSRFLVPFLLWLNPHISPGAVEALQSVIRKLGHLTEYAVLAMLLWRALRGGTNWRAKITILFIGTWFACAIFAASDEFHQSFVPSRTASPIDVMIDIAGALLGLAICSMFARRRRLR